MKQFKDIKAVARAVGIITAVVMVTSGITFAALQSQQIKLIGSTIGTANANMQVSTDGTNFSSSLPGFNFSSIIPGGSAVPTNGFSFYLKNTGDTPLVLKLAVSSTPANPNNIDLTKVNVLLTPAGSNTPMTFPLQSLISTNTSGGVAITTPSALTANNIVHYTLQVSMTSDAMVGSGALLTGIDFAFIGQAIAS